MAAAGEPADGSREELGAAPDEALAHWVQGGDERALEQLVRRYLRPVRVIVTSYLAEPADADDAAQETFLRALRAIESYDPERPFAPWLYQIARNVARNHVETHARWLAETPSTALPSRLPGPDVVLERAEFRTLVRAALARLPEQRRTAFYLADVEGYPTEEIGRLMSLSPGTVRSHLHHARRALRAALAERPERIENTGG
jgi:RNA polymerase sigma-70 factor (ECF subfamily)